MKYLVILTLLTLISCQREESPEYTKGIPIDHAPGHYTTKKDFNLFYLHSWMQDTIYRNCGYEFQIDSYDSTLKVGLRPSGFRIIKAAQKNRFVVDQQDSIVSLKILTNKTDSFQIDFKTPVLPYPDLVKTTIGDSIVLTLEQSDKRIREILPMDCRYGFIVDGESKRKIKIPKEQINDIDFQAFRLSFKNDTFLINYNK